MSKREMRFFNGGASFEPKTGNLIGRAVTNARAGDPRLRSQAISLYRLDESDAFGLHRPSEISEVTSIS